MTVSAVSATPEKLVQANGVELCVQAFGPTDGEPVLLIAGAACSMLYWDEEFCRRLAAGPRFVIRYDHRDTGRSHTTPPGAPDYTPVDLLDDAIGVLDAFGVSRAHLVGLSTGGGLAQTAAIRYPQRVASLTLIATSPAGPSDHSDLPSMSEQVRAEFAAVPQPDWADREQVITFLVEQERLCAARTAPFDSAGMRAVMAAVLDRSPSPQSMFNHFQVIGGDAPPDRMAGITAPTLVLHGDDDPLFPPAHGAALAAEIPGARLITLPQVGHEWPRRAWEPALPEILTHTSGA
ncbi:MAG TPA: alpha/beta hydrolase [Pseudonocardia sp.]|nr:alpha/beta hydrolase [Pseudonocardia sp.]